MYVRVKDGVYIFPYTITDLRHAIRNKEYDGDLGRAVIPDEPDNQTLSQYGVYPVTETEQPDGDVVTSSAIWDGDEFIQVWSSRDFTEAEKAQRRQGMVVSMRQGRLAILNAGLMTNVETILNAMESPEKEAALIEWEYSTTFKRLSPLVVSLGPQLGLTDDQIDALFDQAKDL